MLFYRIQQAVFYRYNQEYTPRAGVLWHYIFMPPFPVFPKIGLTHKKRKSSESLYIHENRKYLYLWLGMSYKHLNNSYGCI